MAERRKAKIQKKIENELNGNQRHSLSPINLPALGPPPLQTSQLSNENHVIVYTNKISLPFVGISSLDLNSPFGLKACFLVFLPLFSIPPINPSL